VADGRATRKDAGQQISPAHNKVFRDFGGMNTQAARTAIAENEFAWLENVMPLGHGNAIIVSGPSAALASVPNGVCYTMQHFNRAGLNFMFMATTTGHAYEVPLDFVGYTVASLVITNPGSGYLSRPTILFTGAANVPAAATVNLTLVGCAVAVAGSGYTLGDILTASGGTFVRPFKVQVTSVNGSGGITGISILDGGDYTVTTNLGVTVLTGGTGTNAAVSCGIGASAGYGIGGTITITNAGLGYQAAPGVVASGGADIPFPFSAGTLTAIVVGSSHGIREITNTGSPELGGGGVAIAQWKNERILIVDPVKGFFDWDGTKLTPSGSVFSLTITTGGSYTSIPTISFSGGGGTGAAASAIMGANGTQAVNAAGTGYVVGDVLTYVGGTFTSAAQVKVTTIGGGGAITAVSVFNPGSYSALPAFPVAVTGGSGTGAAFQGAYAVFAATITNPGTTPYTSAPTVTFSSGAATATANLIAAPPNPERVAVFASRVWVVQGRALSYTAPGTYNDFLSQGSGVTILDDPALDSNVTNLVAANSFLYYTGVDSVNVIGDVTVNSLGNTIFSNTNLSADVGTNFSQATVPYFRSLLFPATNGVYSLYGATPVKISDAMDGVFQGIDFHGLVSGGGFTLANVKCAAFLVLYNTSGQPSTANNSRPLFMIFFNKKWFVANQDTLGRLILIAGAGAADPNYSQNLYGTDGTSLFRLFVDPTNLQTWKLQTAYWDLKDVVKTKQAEAIGFESNGSLGGTVTATVDMVSNQAPFLQTNTYTVPLGAPIQWVNVSGVVIPWLNNVGATIPWVNGGSYLMQMQDAEGFGKYLGMTLTSSDVTGSLSSVILRYIYREDL
jgi:hypothetical protein